MVNGKTIGTLTATLFSLLVASSSPAESVAVGLNGGTKTEWISTSNQNNRSYGSLDLFFNNVGISLKTDGENLAFGFAYIGNNYSKSLQFSGVRDYRIRKVNYNNKNDYSFVLDYVGSPKVNILNKRSRIRNTRFVSPNNSGDYLSIIVSFKNGKFDFGNITANSVNSRFRGGASLSVSRNINKNNPPKTRYRNSRRSNYYKR